MREDRYKTFAELTLRVQEFDVQFEVTGTPSNHVPDANSYGPEYTRGYRAACRTIEEAVKALSQRHLCLVDG
jgi:hypothetical protein